MRHVPSLDGIRAGSFLLVFVAHAGLARFVPGDLGVTIFFFLSGFLITTLMRSECERNGSVNLGHFWLRRALRILPPFYLVLLAVTLMARVLYPPGTVHGSALIAQLLFYANYWGIYGANNEVPGSGVVWSLAVEEHFYLLFPLLYVAMQKWRMSRETQRWLLLGLCVAVLAWRCLLVLVLHATIPRINFATDTRMDSILFGCALAVWDNPVLDKPRQETILWKYLLPAAALGALMLCFALRTARFTEIWAFSVQGVALTVLFICAIRYHTAPAFRILNWRPVAFIGVLSYSLYLVHHVLLRAAEHLWPRWHSWQRAAIALAASMMAAWIIYELIEKPCARLRRKLTD